MNECGRKSSSKPPATKNLMVRSIDEYDILLNDKHAHKRTKGSVLWKRAKMEERLDAHKNTEKYYLPEERKARALKFFQTHYPRLPQFWNKLKKHEDPTPGMILGSPPGHAAPHDALYILLDPSAEEIKKNITSFRYTRGTTSSSRQNKGATKRGREQESTNNSITGTSTRPATCCSDGAAVVSGSDRYPSHCPPISVVPSSDDFRSNVLDLRGEPVAKRRRVSTLAAPAVTTKDSPPPLFNTPSFLKVVKDYTSKSVSSFAAVQSILLQMPANLVQVTKCPYGWDPKAIIPLGRSSCTAYDCAKDLIVTTHDDEITAGEAAAHVMKMYPSSFCLLLSNANEEEEYSSDQQKERVTKIGSTTFDAPRYAQQLQRHTSLVLEGTQCGDEKNLHEVHPIPFLPAALGDTMDFLPSQIGEENRIFEDFKDHVYGANNCLNITEL